MLRCLPSWLLIACFGVTCRAEVVLLNGNDHTGYLSASQIKNWGSEAAALAGLPNYPYYEVRPGLWTSIVAEPLSAASIYAEESTATVFNKSITEVDFSTLGAGQLEYDGSSLTGVGTETIAAAAISFSIDGAAFSPLNSPNNAGGGVGNAGWDYLITVSNPNGSGMTFIDGALTSIDLVADVSVLPRFAGVAAFQDSYDGSVTFTGNRFQFDVDVIQDNVTALGPASDTRIVFNRAGTIAAISAVPEPRLAALLAMASSLCVLRRRRIIT